MKISDGDFMLPVDKPTGPTSHDVVAMARRALRTRRIGHTGTLDPFASGVLVLCVGRATRLAEYLTGMDKQYDAVARLGVDTDTLDREGEVVGSSDAWKGLSVRAIEDALSEQVGDIEQIPPQYSAKKIDGEAMHRRARRGEHVDLPPVPVRIHMLEVVDVRLPEVEFRVHCSSGTYVRCIARDLGAALGCGAHLTSLRRTAVGPFGDDIALPADRFDDDEAVAAARVEPVDALAHLTRVVVDERTADRIRNGQRIRVADPGEPTESLVTVMCARDLLAIASLDDGVLRPRKVFPA